MSLRISACIFVLISLILQCVDAAECMQAAGLYSNVYSGYGYVYYDQSYCWLGYQIISIPIVGSAYISI
jgi:hypothetical protein